MPKPKALLAAIIAVAAGLSCKQNNPPDVPAVPTGPVICQQDSTYTFSTTAVDPDGDSVSVRFLWTEAWQSDWSDLHPGGETVSLSHAWFDEGTFLVRAQARDRGELTSSWSDALTVQVVYRHPPETPEPPEAAGPSFGYPDSSYDFAAVAFHPDSIPVAIRFSWGDGDSSDWSPYVAPGETVLMSHAWSTPDTYWLAAQAKDTNSSTSEWSDSIRFVVAAPDTLCKWRFQLAAGENTELNSSPAIGPDGTIYVGSADSGLYAIHPDGTLRWRYPASLSVQSSPAIATDGTVYFAANDNRVYALNPDGSLRWRHSIGGSTSSSPAIAADGTIYIGSANRYLYAINPDSSHKWGFLTGGAIHASPAIAADGTIYVGSVDSYFYALNPDGTLRWRCEVDGSIHSPPSVGTGGTVYFGSDDDYLYALNPDSTPRWVYSTGGNVRSSAVVAADGTVYIGSNDNCLHALYGDGAPKWVCSIGGDADQTPAIAADGTVYVGSDDNCVYALNPDGSVKWRFKTGYNIESSPAIGADGMVYVVSCDGYLYALKGSSPLADSPWPKFHHDAQNTGRAR